MHRTDIYNYNNIRNYQTRIIRKKKRKPGIEGQQIINSMMDI